MNYVKLFVKKTTKLLYLMRRLRFLKNALIKIVAIAQTPLNRCLCKQEAQDKKPAKKKW